MYGDLFIYSRTKWEFLGYRNIYDYWNTEMHNDKEKVVRNNLTKGLDFYIREEKPNWKPFIVRFQKDRCYSKTENM